MTFDVGWLASGLVFATFCAKRMLPLRALAITSNLAFISYGYTDALWPIVILHAAMLPMNVVRFREAFLAARGAPKRRDGAAAPLGPSILPVAGVSRDATARLSHDHLF
jgi:ABC-type glycerol-3-phosphate transport system permease component